eukprot:TRINITY_DN3732_c0_g1_i3.p1 TRINITY_DN3732_c0_g1~~TRINITY_DN3732_c0_g1_i3.p1  ORF type:complete len:136 (+),score=7.97 TRINITY_DN3732_c0_g1_i3:434-841(+)
MSGDPRFRELTLEHCSNADAVMLVFDMTTPESFHALDAWIHDIQVACKGIDRKKDPMILLIGNKLDVAAKAQSAEEIIGAEIAQIFANKYQILYEETSAKLDINTSTAFIKLLRRLEGLSEEEDLRSCDCLCALF